MNKFCLWSISDAAFWPRSLLKVGVLIMPIWMAIQILTLNFIHFIFMRLSFLNLTPLALVDLTILVVINF